MRLASSSWYVLPFLSFSLNLTHSQGWFIFTTVLLICTLRSTVAFFMLFFTLDLAFLCLGLSYLYAGNQKLLKAGGVFGILAAFLAWYYALAGIADTSNSFFVIPVAHFPWSDKGREKRRASVTDKEAETVLFVSMHCEIVPLDSRLRLCVSYAVDSVSSKRYP